tara:strand:- start:1864 stop:2454 length:591 start_codon:yes stop_codon:yes gene_type:complete
MLKKIIAKIFIINVLLINSVLSAESSGMPQLNPEFWVSQIFWLILTFGILYLVLSKIVLPKISENLETRKSQIVENIETAEKQRKESEDKIKQFEKIILESKIEAKNFFNEKRQKVLEDIAKKRSALEEDIDSEIGAAEVEINKLRNTSGDKINKIAIETSSELIRQLIGEDVNSSSISAIVEDQLRRNKEKQNVI